MKFFDRTYFSAGLSEILASAVSRLTRGGGDAVHLLYTGFGGGKSHTLVAIYHIARSPGKALESARLRKFLEERGLTLPTDLKAAVSVFDGAALDPVALPRRYGAPNPWVFILRELAEAAGDPGLAEWVEEYRSVAPGHDELSRFFSRLESMGYRPVVLIDELAVYLQNLVSGGREREAEAFRVFIHNLAVAASNTRHTLVAIATPQQYESESRKIEAFLSDVQRVAVATSIVGPADAAEVLKNALLRRVDPAVAIEVADRYMSEYKSKASRYPSAALTHDFAESMRRSYPFHPLLVRELYENIAQLQGFQGTRDILRIMAWTLHYKLRDGSFNGTRDFVLLGDVDVTRDDIRNLFKVDNPALRRLLESIAYDIEVVKAIDEEKVRRNLPRVASLVYSAILLRSLSGYAMKQEEVMAGTVSPLRGVSADMVATTLDTLARETAHLHRTVKGGEITYMIKAKANIYMIVNKKAAELLSRRRDLIREKLKERLARMAASSDAKAVVWPEHPGEVEDTPRIKLVLLDPDAGEVTAGERRLETLLNHYARYSQHGGSSFRIHRNTLIFLAPQPEVYGRLVKALARLLAIEMVERERDHYGLQSDDLNTLMSMKSDVEGEISKEIVLLYDKVYYPLNAEPSGDLVFDSTNMASLARETRKLWPAVVDALESSGKLASRGISSSYVYSIVEEMYRNLGSPVSFSMVLNELTGNPRRPIVLRAMEVVAKALRDLVHEGRLVAVNQASGEALCMRPPSRVEEYSFAPCTSPEAAKYCSPTEEPGVGMVCRPKPPKDCTEPEWDPYSKSWRCKAIEERETGEHGTIGTGMEPVEERRLRPPRVSLDYVNLAELEERVREKADLNLKVRDLYLEVSMKDKPETARTAVNHVFLALDEIATKASRSYNIEARFMLSVEQDAARGTIDLTFSDVKKMKNVTPGIVQLMASVAKEVEVTVQLTLKSEGEETIRIGDVVNAFNRTRLIGVSSLTIKRLDIIAKPSEQG